MAPVVAVPAFAALKLFGLAKGALALKGAVAAAPVAKAAVAKAAVTKAVFVKSAAAKTAMGKGGLTLAGFGDIPIRPGTVITPPPAWMTPTVLRVATGGVMAIPLAIGVLSVIHHERQNREPRP